MTESAHDDVSTRAVASCRAVEFVSEEAGREACRREQRHDRGEEPRDLERDGERLPGSGGRHEVQGEEEQRVVHRRGHRDATRLEVADDAERERDDPDDDRGHHPA